MTLFRFLAKPALSTVKRVPFRQELLPESIKGNERHERSPLFEGFSFCSASSVSFCFLFSTFFLTYRAVNLATLQFVCRKCLQLAIYIYI